MNGTGFLSPAEEYILVPGITTMAQYYHHHHNNNNPETNLTLPSASGDAGADDSTAVSASLASTRFVVQTIVTPIVVTIGLLGNLLNVLVLVQPSMRTSTNVYLLTLSVADVVYLVFSFALSFVGCRRRGLSYAAYAFNTYGRTISDMAGNVAVWIVVIFTVERYVAVCHPMHGKIWCTVTRAKLFSLGAFFFCFVNTSPGFFELEITVGEDGPKCTYTQFAQTPAYELGYTWWFVTIFSFIPFVFLLIFNSLLIHALIRANRERELMLVGRGANERDRYKEAGRPRGKCSVWRHCCVCSHEKLDGGWEMEYVSPGGRNLCVRTKDKFICCFAERRTGSHALNGCIRDGSSRWESRLRSSVHTKVTVCRSIDTQQVNETIPRLEVNQEQRETGGCEGGRQSHSDAVPTEEEGKADSCVIQRQETGSSAGCDTLMNRRSGKECRTNYGATPVTTPLSSRFPSPSNSINCSPSVSPRSHSRHSRRSHEQHKVTLMLIVIVIIFLLCQLPWTILYLYRAYLSAHNMSAAGSDAMKIAGNVVNLLAQINASGNFYLYSFFSKRFRRTLARLFTFWRSELSMSSVHV